MATLVNKMNREVKVIIPNMREFRVFYSDNEGSVMFFKRDWREEKQEEHWKPSEEQMEALEKAIVRSCSHQYGVPLSELYEQLKKL
jgi:hypothetical protein